MEPGVRLWIITRYEIESPSRQWACCPWAFPLTQPSGLPVVGLHGTGVAPTPPFRHWSRFADELLAVTVPAGGAAGGVACVYGCWAAEMTRTTARIARTIAKTVVFRLLRTS